MNSTNKQKNKILNSHAVAGAYEKTNALAKLTSAIQVFNKNKGEIYDINKHEARSLYARAGSNFPPRISCTGRPQPPYIRRGFACQQELHGTAEND